MELIIYNIIHLAHTPDTLRRLVIEHKWSSVGGQQSTYAVGAWPLSRLGLGSGAKFKI